MVQKHRMDQVENTLIRLATTSTQQLRLDVVEPAREVRRVAKVVGVHIQRRIRTHEKVEATLTGI